MPHRRGQEPAVAGHHQFYQQCGEIHRARLHHAGLPPGGRGLAVLRRGYGKRHLRRASAHCFRPFRQTQQLCAGHRAGASGFIDCHFQESAHISLIPFSAAHPNSSFAFVASQ